MKKILFGMLTTILLTQPIKTMESQIPRSSSNCIVKKYENYTLTFSPLVNLENMQHIPFLEFTILDSPKAKEIVTTKSKEGELLIGYPQNLLTILSKLEGQHKSIKKDLWPTLSCVANLMHLCVNSNNKESFSNIEFLRSAWGNILNKSKNCSQEPSSSVLSEEYKKLKNTHHIVEIDPDNPNCCKLMIKCLTKTEPITLATLLAQYSKLPVENNIETSLEILNALMKDYWSQHVEGPLAEKQNSVNKKQGKKNKEGDKKRCAIS